MSLDKKNIKKGINLHINLKIIFNKYIKKIIFFKKLC